MSLQVWLPLNGDLNQQGISTSTVAVSTATIDNNGKIGKCYSFTEGQYIGIDANNINNHKYSPLSIAMWVYPTQNDSSERYLISCYESGGAGIHLQNSKLDFVVYVSGYKHCISQTITLNAWHHVCGVYDGVNSYIYVDGELHNTLTVNGTITYHTTCPWEIGGNPGGASWASGVFVGKINDVRIYDNALSETEIKKLSQGLVVHLPLNNNGLGQENLLRGSNLVGSSSVYGWVTNGTATGIESDGTIIHYKYNLSNSKMIPSITTNTVVPCEFGKTYIYSMDLKCDKPMNLSTSVPMHYWAGARNSNLITNTSCNGNLTGISVQFLENHSGTCPANTWVRIRTKFTFPAAATSEGYNYPAIRCFVYGTVFSEAYTGEVNVWVKNVKVEEGSIPTPWCPHKEDTMYPYTGSAINENLFISSNMEEEIVSNGSTDWTKHFRMYNGSAAIHTITTDSTTGIKTDTIALAAVSSNLGISFVRLNDASLQLDSNEYYTISCEAKCTNANFKLCIGRSYYNTGNTWVWRGGENAKTFTAADTWQKITHTFKPDYDTQAICYCFTINPGTGSSGSESFSIRKCKLEKGSVATEWQPSPYDELHSTGGYSNNIIYDQSGYNHNGYSYGVDSAPAVLTHTSDSPKYNVSTHFSDTKQFIKIPNLITSGFGDSYTFAWWEKRNSYNNTMAWGFSNGIRLNGLYAGTLWNTGDSANNPLYLIGTTTQVSTPATGVWYHWVMTGDGTHCYVYKNGLLYAEAKTYKSISGTIIYINGWNDQVNYSMNNYSISDFRIYATALSEKDVLSLYNNTAYIDSDNNIHGKIRD